MHSIALVQTGSADAAWAQTQAGRDLRDAIEAVDTARGSLAHLTADTEWRSEGMRSLHALLNDVDRRTAAETSDLHRRESELTGIVVS